MDRGVWRDALVAATCLAASVGFTQATRAAAGETIQAGDDPGVRLRGIEDDLRGSDAHRKALSATIAAVSTDRARLHDALLAVAAEVSAAEERIADAEARLVLLGGKRAATERSLQGRRAIVTEVLAALQRMGRKPPPALLVEPGDVLKAVRTSMLLGSVVPGMRAEIDALQSDLEDLTRTRTAIASEREAIDREIAALAIERSRLAGLIDARQAALGQAESEAEAERGKAKQLAAEAGSLKDLIGRSERESAAAGAAAEAARSSDERLAMVTPDPRGPTPSKDPARLAPAVAFASTKGTLAAPTGGGTVLRRFGEDDGLGGTEKGTVFAAHAGATVTAPADGWIAFAGPYRSFGQLLILNTGGGYYIVLAGMDRVNVTSGQFVLAGEPVGAMGDGSNKTAAAVALGVAQPVLYVEFRKDGATIDPGPWWAKPELQKVRG